MKKIVCLLLAIAILCLCGCSEKTVTEKDLSSEEEFFLENEYSDAVPNNDGAANVPDELKKYSGTWYGYGTDGTEAVTPGRTLTFINETKFNLGEETFILISEDTAESVADHETSAGENDAKILLEFGSDGEGEPALASYMIKKSDRKQMSEMMCYYRQNFREKQDFKKGLSLKVESPEDSDTKPKHELEPEEREYDTDYTNYDQLAFWQRYDLIDSKEIADGPQAQMNISSGEIYKEWDNLLNDVYQYLKKTLPADEFKALKNDEIRWIKKKEAAIAEAEAEYYGGSMRPLMMNGVGIEYTKERCAYLISLIR